MLKCITTLQIKLLKTVSACQDQVHLNKQNDLRCETSLRHNFYKFSSEFFDLLELNSDLPWNVGNF